MATTKAAIAKIDGIGPVTTNVSRLQDRKNHTLWLYFGTGRYYYGNDDSVTQRKIIALKEPCYTGSDTIDPNCASFRNFPADFTNQSGDTPSATLGTALGLYTDDKGWYINLDAGTDLPPNYGAERVITDPVAMTNGAVFFTTYEPTTDACPRGEQRRDVGVKSAVDRSVGKDDVDQTIVVEELVASDGDDGTVGAKQQVERPPAGHHGTRRTVGIQERDPHPGPRCGSGESTVEHGDHPAVRKDLEPMHAEFRKRRVELAVRGVARHELLELVAARVLHVTADDERPVAQLDDVLDVHVESAAEARIDHHSVDAEPGGRLTVRDHS
jgi:hypothetical protein